MSRHPLTFAGGDVVLVRRQVTGQVVGVYLGRDGQPTSATVVAWPHELRGVGWHMAAIKAVVERLPLDGAPMNPAPEPPAAAARWLFAHHVAAHTDRQED